MGPQIQCLRFGTTPLVCDRDVQASQGGRRRSGDAFQLVASSLVFRRSHCPSPPGPSPLPPLPTQAITGSSSQRPADPWLFSSMEASRKFSFSVLSSLCFVLPRGLTRRYTFFGVILSPSHISAWRYISPFNYCLRGRSQPAAPAPKPVRRQPCPSRHVGE
jgi:hypothetical protein